MLFNTDVGLTNSANECGYTSRPATYSQPNGSATLGPALTSPPLSPFVNQQQQQQQQMQQRQEELGIPLQNGAPGYMQQRESPSTHYIGQRSSPNPQQFIDCQRESPQGPAQGYREVQNPAQYLRPESHESASTGY
uniref:Uncharacterized protein n=1 Tax=Lygus hesperus TaxID=30085 RepID=A0A146LPM0_LYGHE